MDDDEDLEWYRRRREEEEHRAKVRERTRRTARDLIRDGNLDAASLVYGIEPPGSEGEARTPSLEELEQRRERLLSDIEASTVLPAKWAFRHRLANIDLAAADAPEQLRSLRLDIQDAGVLEAGSLLTRPVTDFDTLDIQKALASLASAVRLRLSQNRS